MPIHIAADGRTRPLLLRIASMTGNPIDFALVTVTLWLLVSMIVDALTPKWLTVYMVGGALAPRVLMGIFLHFRRWSKLRKDARHLQSQRQKQRRLLDL